MVDNRPLSNRDLLEVTEEVEDVTKWYELGLALGLHAPVLDMIKEENHHAVRTCKREMLKEWLRRSCAAQPSSWRELVKALRRKSVGNHDVADSIVRDHSTTAPPPKDRVAVEHPRMHAVQLTQPPSSWPTAPYSTPLGTVSSGYSQPPYNHRPFQQYGSDPTQPLHGNVAPAGFRYPPPPQPASRDPSAPWSHNPSYPTYSLREEQLQHDGRFERNFEHQFGQIATSDEEKKKMIQLIFSKHQAKMTAAVQTDLVRFAHMLEGHQIINRHVAQDAHGIAGKGPYELAAHILSAVRNKVENYPQYFPRFVQCLENFDADLSRDLTLHWQNKLSGRN